MLTPVAPEELSALVHEVEHTLRRCLDEQLGQYATSLTQCQAMHAIGRNPGVPQYQLARLTNQSDQAFNTLMSRLAARGFVERRVSRRRVAIHDLTVVGRGTLRQADELIQSVMHAAWAPLTEPERQTLRVMLRRVLAAERLGRLEPLPEPVW